MALQAILRSWTPLIEVSRSHSRTRAHTVGLLWTSDHLITETIKRINTTKFKIRKVIAKSCRKMRKKVFIMLTFETAFGL